MWMYIQNYWKKIHKTGMWMDCSMFLHYRLEASPHQILSGND